MSQALPNIKLLPHRSLKATFRNFFSEFGPLSPEVQHDRPERSLYMRLYLLNKQSLSLVLVAFFACFSLGIFIGIAGPEIDFVNEIDASKLQHNDSNDENFLAKGPFKINSQYVSTYDRQIWLFAKYSIKNTEAELFDTSFSLNIKIFGLDSDNFVPILDGKNRTRHLTCKGSTCDDFTILHLGWLEYYHYQFIVTFYGLSPKRYEIEKLTFYIKTFNPAYTTLEISFRLIFLMFTFIVTVWYHTLLRKYPSSNWSIEQKFTYILLVLLIFFDNPLFPLMFLVNSWFVGMLDAIFQSTFLCGLLLFWISIYHALRQNERKFATFYAPKLLILLPIWLCAFTLAIWEKLDEMRDPTFIHFVDGSYSQFMTCFYVSLAIYILYLIFLMFSAYGDLRSMQYFDMRLKFLSLLMIFVMTVTILTTMSRFGFGIVEDNFIGQLATSYKNSAHFMCFYGMLNFYIITIAYVYSPVQSSIVEPVRKDNPTFSMINDSDEEVVYASEDDSRRPLNAMNKINAEYDSD